MNAIVLFLHFFGLMLGSAGGMGSAVIMRRAMSMPADQAQTVRSLGPLLAQVSAAGLVLLWLTGIVLVFTHGGIANMPGLFWAKLLFVVVVTVVVGLVHMTYAQIRRTGNAALGKRLAMLGPASGAATLLAVLFAVYAFY